MSFLSELSLLILVALGFPVFGKIAYLAEICTKCCPTAVHFNGTFNQCQVKNFFQEKNLLFVRCSVVSVNGIW